MKELHYLLSHLVKRRARKFTVDWILFEIPIVRLVKAFERLLRMSYGPLNCNPFKYFGTYSSQCATVFQYCIMSILYA